MPPKNQAEQLTALCAQIDHLAGARVERVGRCYFVRGDFPPIYFQSFNVGRDWLQRWIKTGSQPSYALLRVR